MRRRLLAFLKSIRFPTANAAQVLGLAFVGYGIWLWSPPAAYIVAGLGIIFISLGMER